MVVGGKQSKFTDTFNFFWLLTFLLKIKSVIKLAHLQD